MRSFLLVALGLGYVGPALHFGLVQHELCAEHGELRHVGAHALSAEVSSSRAPVADAAPAAVDEHEHCAVVATSSAPSLSVPAGAFEASLGAEAKPAALAPASTAHNSLALLHYAPKLAPPVETSAA